MYFEGSVVGKASSIGIGISFTLPLIFTGTQKVLNLTAFETLLNFEPHAFENAARYPKSETKVQCRDDRPMSWPSLLKLGPRTPEKSLSVLIHPIKLHAKTREIVDNSAVDYSISLKFATKFKRMTPDVL